MSVFPPRKRFKISDRRTIFDSVCYYPIQILYLTHIRQILFVKFVSIVYYLLAVIGNIFKVDTVMLFFLNFVWIIIVIIIYACSKNDVNSEKD